VTHHSPSRHWLRKLFGFAFPRTATSWQEPRRRHRPFLEILENRLTPSTANQNFVSLGYQDLLHRQADVNGLNAATSFLDLGGSRLQWVQTVLISTEYLTNQVNVVYHRFLARAADPDGLNAAMAFLQHGGTVEQLGAAVANSAEFLAFNGGTNDGWLDGLYAALESVGSPPGTINLGSKADWDAAFARGVTRLEVAQMLISGFQFSTATATTFYQIYLRRDPEPAGLDSAARADFQFGSAGTRAQFVASPEYFTFAQINPPTPILP
jgi:hypothetical protein